MSMNSEQREAVKAEGPCFVIAGAGTGKTKTIVEKIAHLISKGVSPESILALTFSNEAAAQLKERAIELAPAARDCHISTFHKFCADYLREEREFSIMEELDGAILLKRKLGLQTGTALHFANTISKAKDLGITIDEYRKYLKDQEKLLDKFSKDWPAAYNEAIVKLRTAHINKDSVKHLHEFVELYENYSSYLSFVETWEKYEELKGDNLDYADLNKLVLEHIDTYGTEGYEHIIVDEFQDTNKVQFLLLQRLAKQNITVVGDQDQTVYAFRGAYSDNIEKFIEAFHVPEENIIKLQTNYRSTDKILRTAHELIKNNYDSPERAIQLKGLSEGTPVRIIQTEDPREQARRIVEDIEKLKLPYRDIAVLYRSHSSAGAIKKALQQRGIPYSTIAGADFFFTPEIKTAISYLYVLNNFEKPLLQADQAWWRLLTGRFGLSNIDSTNLAEYRKRTKRSLQKILHEDLSVLSPEGKRKVTQLIGSIEKLRQNRNKKITDLLLDIYDVSGLARQYSNHESMSNLKYLYRLAGNFETFHDDDLGNFIAYLEIVDEMGSKLAASQRTDEESVKLMTIHAAKGLEFEAVFLIDLVRDKFPLTRGGAEPLIPKELNEQYKNIPETELREFTSRIKLREERRLGYVALTRAKTKMFLCLAKDYSGPREPSQFLFELGAKPEWFQKSSAAAADLEFTYDSDMKAKDGGDTELDRAAAAHKKLIDAAISRRDIRTANYHMIIYKSLLEGHPVGHGPASAEAAKILETIKENPTGLRFPSVNFSVSSLGTYLDCPKKYELKHVLNMPSRDDEDEGPFAFGSVIHDILDLAAKTKIKERSELDKLLEQQRKPDGFDLPRAQRILDVFWARGMGDVIATEKFFRFSLDGFNFHGKIDRIDKIGVAGQAGARIVDYKTGYTKSDVAKDARERQLILYALAIQHDPELKKLNLEPRELVLEMLEKEKPLEFVLENSLMSPKAGRIKPVKVDDIKKNIIDTAKNIAHDYEQGFHVSEADTPCRFCSYKLYCPKWG